MRKSHHPITPTIQIVDYSCEALNTSLEYIPSISINTKSHAQSDIVCLLSQEELEFVPTFDAVLAMQDNGIRGLLEIACRCAILDRNNAQITSHRSPPSSGGLQWVSPLALRALAVDVWKPSVMKTTSKIEKYFQNIETHGNKVGRELESKTKPEMELGLQDGKRNPTCWHWLLVNWFEI